ncbi:MAG: GIY-YIG nuclease family protein [Deltaproteobacteria bacterium]|nr:GIY-YIG nuclease family protein [Deltaproteobacteria bacterium]
MSTYGGVPQGNALIAQFHSKQLSSYTFELYPELWATPRIAEYYKSRTWAKTRFVDPPTITIPTQSGIYMFVVAPHCADLHDHSYIFYVGKTDNLRRRYRQYLREQRGEGQNPREKVVKFLHHLCDHVYFHFTLVPESELAEAENLLKDNLTPPANERVTIIGRLSTPSVQP